MTQLIHKPLSKRWLWLVPGLLLSAVAVVSAGGYVEIASRIVPFEEVAPRSLEEASAALRELGERKALYRRWQFLDALFVALQIGMFLVVAAVATSAHARYRRTARLIVVVGCAVLAAAEMMENAAILGLLDGRDRLDLLQLGVAAKWAVFPWLALATVLILGWLAARALLARGRTFVRLA